MSCRKRGAGRLIQGVLLLLSLLLLPVWGEAQPTELDAIYKRGLQLYQAGRVAEAVPIAEQYVAVAFAKFGDESPQYATGLTYLAVLHRHLNQMVDAETLLKRALAIKQNTLPADHIEIAELQYELALVYHAQVRYMDAEPLYVQSLAIAERTLGSDHLKVAAILNGLGQIRTVEGHYAEAELLLRRALAIRERQLGSEHLDTASSLSNLAVLLEEGFGRYEEAEKLKRRALAVVEKRLGPNHLDVATYVGSEPRLFSSITSARRIRSSASVRRLVVWSNWAKLPVGMFGTKDLLIYTASARL